MIGYHKILCDQRSIELDPKPFTNCLGMFSIIAIIVTSLPANSSSWSTAQIYWIQQIFGIFHTPVESRRPYAPTMVIAACLFFQVLRAIYTLHLCCALGSLGIDGPVPGCSQALISLHSLSSWQGVVAVDSSSQVYKHLKHSAGNVMHDMAEVWQSRSAVFLPENGFR